MSSHMGTNFLNSCLKVPIDPCNNCPAPVYNRPKIYLGRSTTSTSKVTTTSKLSDFNLDLETMFATSGMRSLAKFYDSIPDYCEVNHLPEEEFYTTLETLKSTCRHLKSKPSSPLCVRNDSCCSPVSQQSYDGSRSCKVKVSKSSKKRSGSRKSCTKKEYRSISASPCVSSYRNLCERMKILNYKKFDNLEIERVAEEPKAPIRRESTSLHKSLSVCHLPREDIKPEGPPVTTKERRIKEVERPKLAEKTSPRPYTPAIRESLKKSFSYNDLHSNYWEDDLKVESAMRFRRYFEEKIKSPRTNEEDVPKITVQPPSLNDNRVGSGKASSFGSASSTRKKKLKSKNTESTRVPFSFLGINECKLSDKISGASPIHPVARPNLAATLRAEVSKKKVKQLQSNCTYQDHTPQVDWEVRKTPAWKTLGLNESHKEILALRLATRQAEQALQKREYELHMELMRQRVKSAPLLLEGATFWGPHVGKLSHTCHKDSLKHTCQHGKKTRRKSAGSKPPPHRKCLSNKSYSRNSNHSLNAHDSDELCSLDRAYL